MKILSNKYYKEIERVFYYELEMKICLTNIFFFNYRTNDFVIFNMLEFMIGYRI